VDSYWKSLDFFYSFAKALVESDEEQGIGTRE